MGQVLFDDRLDDVEIQFLILEYCDIPKSDHSQKPLAEFRIEVPGLFQKR